MTRLFSHTISEAVMDLGLDPYAFRLYGHIRRVCGEPGNDGKCLDSTRMLAAACRMSAGKVSESRQLLLQHGLIRIVAAQTARGIASALEAADAPGQFTFDPTTAAPGFVYLIAGEGLGAGLYKIGKTTRVDGRMSDLSILPFPTRLVHTIQVGNMGLAEGALHDRFKAKQERGEWYRLDLLDVIWVCSLQTL